MINRKQSQVSLPLPGKSNLRNESASYILAIPTEIIQLFTTSEASGYRLVPYELAPDGALKCYGETGHDYSEAVTELSVIYDFRVAITAIDCRDLELLLNRYYAQERASHVTVSMPQGRDSDFVFSLIREAESNHASDIHFEPYEKRCRIRFRIDGKLIERYVIDLENYPALVNRIKILSNLDISEKRLPQDGRFLYESDSRRFDLRVSVLPAIFGEKIVLRLLAGQASLPDLKYLGFTGRQYEDYTCAVERPNGLILISGPTGSGKSTTLYATLRKLNKENVNILTIEDPVEYTLEGINQVQLKEDIGLTFASALRTFLRQDPDIIMLGEIRDHDTAQMAIRSSLTGHLLLSTIHTNSAWGIVTRLKDMEVHPWLISDTLVACIAQRLVRLLCPHCKREKKINGNFPEDMQQGINKVYEATGCPHCFQTGYSGRKAIYEVIPIDDFLSSAIRKDVSDVRDYLARNYISSLKDAAVNLLKEGHTSPDEILSVINN
jgi:type IV pilus assembly protein PilB